MPEALRVIFTVWFGALGLAVGSFLNVCIYRLPRGLAVTGRSHCPNCGATLRILDLVPLFSQLCLRSRCRHCWTPFSWRYFTIEALVGALYAWLFAYAGRHGAVDWVWLGTLVVAVPCLIAVIVVDLETYTIPDGILIALLVAGVGAEAARWALQPGYAPRFAPAGIPIPNSLAGAALGFGGLWLLGWLFARVLGEEAMGFGDIKFLGAAGALLGPEWLLLWFFIVAVALGALVGLAAVAVRRLGRIGDSEHRVARTRLPFGPFLAVALGLALLWPEELAWTFAALYGFAA